MKGSIKRNPVKYNWISWSLFFIYLFFNSGMSQAHIHTVNQDGSTDVQHHERFVVSAGFLNSLGLIYGAYFVGQTALANDDIKETKNAVSALRIIATSTKGREFDLDEPVAKHWQDLNTVLLNQTQHVEHLSEIETVRKVFEYLSVTMLEIEQSFGHGGNLTYYEVFCPMAFDNEGATWLQKDTQIQNPFLGSKMAQCGEVKGEYKPLSGAQHQRERH